MIQAMAGYAHGVWLILYIVNELRASVGLGPMHPIPEPGPPLAADKRHELEETQAWWKRWLAGKGWKTL